MHRLPVPLLGSDPATLLTTSHQLVFPTTLSASFSVPFLFANTQTGVTFPGARWLEPAEI